MRNDAARLLRALVRSEKGQPLGGILPHGCLVALSRECACGGEEIAQMLAKKLRVRCFDRELLDAVVREANLDREALERLDEHVSGRMEAWVYSALLGRNASPDDYWRNMSSVMVRIAERGGVLVGRGAHLILAHRAFRVRVTGSPDICALRLSHNAGIPLEQARKRVIASNEERAAFVRTHFRRFVGDASTYDLVLNTDRLEFEPATRIILYAMQQAGHPVPEEALT